MLLVSVAINRHGCLSYLNIFPSAILPEIYWLLVFLMVLWEPSIGSWIQIGPDGSSQIHLPQPLYWYTHTVHQWWWSPVWSVQSLVNPVYSKTSWKMDLYSSILSLYNYIFLDHLVRIRTISSQCNLDGLKY